MKIEVQFQPERETQNTWRFRELDENGNPRPQYGDPNQIIGTIYVRKGVLNGGHAPKVLKVTLESETE